MAVKVVDASALGALLFGEPTAESIAEQLTGARLLAPTLLGFQLANVCAIKIRRYPEQAESLRAAFRLRDALGAESIAVDHESVVGLACRTGLTDYGASYLSLAREVGAELVTLNRQLAGAAASATIVPSS